MGEGGLWVRVHGLWVRVSTGFLTVAFQPLAVWFATSVHAANVSYQIVHVYAGTQ